MSKVKFTKNVYNPVEFPKVVNTNFTSFIKPTPEVDTDTVDELFRLYELLYTVIDIEGDTQSHEYLVKKSSEVYDFVKNTEEIQPLLDEIAQLRQQLLEANAQIIQLQSENII